MKQKSKSFWRLLCYALGSKAGKDNREADLVAIIRLLFVLQVITTNSFIIIGVARHFNDNHSTNIHTLK
jgi:hypothetical protein